MECKAIALALLLLISFVMIEQSFAVVPYLAPSPAVFRELNACKQGLDQTCADSSYKYVSSLEIGYRKNAALV